MKSRRPSFLRLAIAATLLTLAPPAARASREPRRISAFTIQPPEGFDWVALPDGGLRSGRDHLVSTDVLGAVGGTEEEPAVFSAIMDRTPCGMSESCFRETEATEIAMMKKVGVTNLVVRSSEVVMLNGVRCGRTVLDGDFTQFGRGRMLMYLIPNETRLLGLTYTAHPDVFDGMMGSFVESASATKGAVDFDYDTRSTGFRLGYYLGPSLPYLAILLLILIAFAVSVLVRLVRRMRHKSTGVSTPDPH